jgi:hypothetical protein
MPQKSIYLISLFHAALIYLFDASLCSRRKYPHVSWLMPIPLGQDPSLGLSGNWILPTLMGSSTILPTKKPFLGCIYHFPLSDAAIIITLFGPFFYIHISPAYSNITMNILPLFFAIIPPQKVYPHCIPIVSLKITAS